MQQKETNRNLLNLLIIACVIILLGILCGFVFGILDLGETAGIILRTAGLLLLISLGMKLISRYYKKPLTKEIEEEGVKESEQKDEKQLLFKPSVGVSVMFLFFLFIFALPICSQFTDIRADLGLAIASIGGLVLFTWLWYTVPVFIFAEDSVQIKSHLFYLLCIDRKTVTRYADITSVGPNQNIKANMWGVEPKHSIVITVNDGTKQKCSLGWFNSEIIAKIYLRFQEKLGDKVTLQ